MAGLGPALALLFQIILQIMGYLMERAKITIQQKESFYKFVKEMSDTGLTPARLKTSADEQLERLKKMKEDLSNHSNS